MDKILGKRVLCVALSALILAGCSVRDKLVSKSAQSEVVSSEQSIDMEDVCFVLLDSRLGITESNEPAPERVSIKEAKEHLSAKRMKFEREKTPGKIIETYRLTIPYEDEAYDSMSAQTVWCQDVGRYKNKHVISYGGSRGERHGSTGIALCWKEGDYIHVKGIHILPGDDSVFDVTISEDKTQLKCKGMISTYTLAALAGLDDETVIEGPYQAPGDRFKCSLTYDLKKSEPEGEPKSKAEFLKEILESKKMRILSIDIEEPNDLPEEIKRLIAFKMKKGSNETIHITEGEDMRGFLQKFGEAYKKAAREDQYGLFWKKLKKAVSQRARSKKAALKKARAKKAASKKARSKK